jgi:hypothetical protein
MQRIQDVSIRPIVHAAWDHLDAHEAAHAGKGLVSKLAQMQPWLLTVIPEGTVSHCYMTTVVMHSTIYWFHSKPRCVNGARSALDVLSSLPPPPLSFRWTPPDVYKQPAVCTYPALKTISVLLNLKNLLNTFSTYPAVSSSSLDC